MIKIPIWKSKITNPHWNNPYRGYVLFAMRDIKDLNMWDYETFIIIKKIGIMQLGMKNVC